MTVYKNISLGECLGLLPVLGKLVLWPELWRDMTEDEGAKEKAGRLEVKKYSSIFEISFLGSTMALLSLQMW